MGHRKPAAYITKDFMNVVYKMLVYIQPDSGINEYLRSELIVTMNRLIDEMKPHIEAADAIQDFNRKEEGHEQ